MNYVDKIKSEKSCDPFAIKEGKFGVLDASYRRLWSEESFIDSSGKKETVKKSLNYFRFKLLFGGFILMLGILFSRTAWLQIVKGDYYYQMAEGNRVRMERIESKRGIIYDRQGYPLVRNAANFMIYAIPADLPHAKAERDNLLRQVSAEAGLKNPDDLIADIGQIPVRSLEAYQPFFVADNIPYERAIKLYLQSDRMSGVVISSKARREYNSACASLSHILGYTGKISAEELLNYGSEYLPIDYVGKMGIEYFWENYLKGKSGAKQIEVDALGKEKKVIGQKNAEDGRNLVLSLDVKIQQKLEQILAMTLEKNHLERGSAIIVDPMNGEVIAMASLPAYDNNVFARGIMAEEYKALIENPSQPLFNRAVSGEYPSGSTIKPVMAAAALQERVVSEDTKFLSNGGLRIGQWFFPDWQSGGHGMTDVRKAIAQSVNTYFYYIGGGYEDFQGLGPERIVRYGSMFGLGTQTGIDLPGETGGFLPTPEWKEETKHEPWYIGDTYHLSIGQGDLLVTPIQVAMYTAAFANGGDLFRPHLVKLVLNSQDQAVSEIKEEPIRKRFIGDYEMKAVREGMRETVMSGSARSLQSVPVPVAGKTGTAQWSSKKDPHAWFIGFAPFENPEITITVLIEEGKEGSTVAVPVAREFLTWYFSGQGQASTATTTNY